MGSNLNMNGHGIKGISYLEGHGGADLLMKSNLSMNGHDVTGAGLVKGDTGEFTNLTAVNGSFTGTLTAKNATFTGEINLTGDVNIGGKTLMKYINDNLEITVTEDMLSKDLRDKIGSEGSSGPSGILMETDIRNKVGSLTVKKDKWYRVAMSSGSGAGSKPNRRRGVSMTADIQAKANGTWHIKKWVTTNNEPYMGYAGGYAVELLDGSTTIAILGGGGGGRQEGTEAGGDAGLPTTAGGAVAGKAGSNGGAGGAAANGTRTENESGVGGAGWTCGKPSGANGASTTGGGGSSYINTSYSIKWQLKPAYNDTVGTDLRPGLPTGVPLNYFIQIWEHK